MTKLPKVTPTPITPEFEKSTKVVTEQSPYGEGLLSYELRMPNNWTDNVQPPPVEAGANTGISSSVLGILGRYIGAPKNLVRSSITIEGQAMAYEISAMHWFINFILLNGFSLTAITEKSSQEIEALYVQVDKDQTFIVRARVVVNGNRLLMIRYYLPQENYDEEKTQQGQIIASLKMTKPTKERIEKQETYGFLDQSYFNYPDSWQLKEKSILSIERMSALLYQEKMDEKTSVLEGYIRIHVISRLLKTSLAQEIETFRKSLKIPDYSIGDLIEAVEYDYDPSIKYGKAQIYDLVPSDPVNMKSYEYLVTVMQGDDFYYITSMITPSREQDFYNWARNMEAAKVVNESIRRRLKPDVIDPNDPYYDYLKDYEEPAAQNSVPAGSAQPSSVTP